MQSENSIVNSNDLDKKSKKKTVAEFIMPTKDNYSMLLSVNYSIKQLKEIAIQHKIKVNSSLVKAELVNKIYNYFNIIRFLNYGF